MCVCVCVCVVVVVCVRVGGVLQFRMAAQLPWRNTGLCMGVCVGVTMRARGGGRGLERSA